MFEGHEGEIRGQAASGQRLVSGYLLEEADEEPVLLIRPTPKFVRCLLAAT
jgi:hypothetical protein